MKRVIFMMAEPLRNRKSREVRERNGEGEEDVMAKTGSQARSNPRYGPSPHLDTLTGCLSADFLQADSLRASGHRAAQTGRIHDCNPASLLSTTNPCIFGGVHT